MKTYVSILAAAAGVLGLATAANAEDAPPMAAPNAGGAYNDTACGTWQGDQWQSNGACATTNYKHAVVAGTITIVKGHLVTLQQTNGTIVIDDSAALNNGTTGRVAASSNRRAWLLERKQLLRDYHYRRPTAASVAYATI